MLPEWRYWPAVPFAALIFVAIAGVSIPKSPPQQTSAEHGSYTVANDEPTPDERLADYTLWLERFTALLAVVSALQVVLLIRSDRKMADTAALTARQVDLAEKQFLMEGKQADLAERQHGLQRIQFFATHRPRLRIRNIRPKFRDGEPITIHCTVTNIGETNARLEAQEIILSVFPDRSVQGFQSPIRLLASDLVAGQSEVFLTEKGTSFVYSQAWSMDQPHGGPVLIRGSFLYLDDNNIARRMGFSRQYNPTTGRFDMIDSHEDEYED